MLEVEDWTQPTHNKRRISSRKITSAENSEPKDVFPPTQGKLSPSALPLGPPEGEVEDTFLVTHPNSHLFPVRGRSNSSPTARPSSLSRLLAQASSVTENPPAPAPAPEINRSPSPPFSPPPPPSPSIHTGSVPQAPNAIPMNHNIAPSIPSPSPLRPGSRSSRLSTTSRFSVSRIPTLGTVASSQPSKAAPTTAISDQVMAASPSSADNPFMSPVTPSPDESITDAMSSAMNNQNRRRRTSYQAPRASPLASGSSQSTVVPPSVTSVIATPPSIVTTTNAFANLASSWGMSFGKKKKAELGGSGGSNLTPTVESPRDASPSDPLSAATKDVNARDLLRRF